MENFRWLAFSLTGAVFAAIVSVVTKPALKKIDVTIGLLVQGISMVAVFAVLTTFTGKWSQLGKTPAWALAMMAGAGVAAGLAWFFGYQGLQLATVAKATPIDRLSLAIAVVLAMIFLKERPSAVNWVGVGLMLAGAICVARSNGDK